VKRNHQKRWKMKINPIPQAGKTYLPSFPPENLTSPMPAPTEKREEQ
jgi:hypothetical protein